MVVQLIVEEASESSLTSSTAWALKMLILEAFKTESTAMTFLTTPEALRKRLIDRTDENKEQGRRNGERNGSSDESGSTG